MNRLQTNHNQIINQIYKAVNINIWLRNRNSLNLKRKTTLGQPNL
jgi:hypothetical protein